MTPETRLKLAELFDVARGLPASGRAVYLDRQCAGDSELRRQLDQMLKHDQTGDQLLDRPAWEGMPTETQVSEGTLLGPYSLESHLGAGGMGEVFRATDTRLGRSVAVKVCASIFSDRFEREARAIAVLNHPHICTLFDVGPNYLVMELIEGETLAARLRRGALSPEEVLRYGAQISDALAEAHRLGVIHRDLKPSNIMLTRNGVKVLDFGIAKTTTTPGLTETNAVIGTPAYMAPEQLQGKPVDARSDLFSLGLVLYEMATGTPPFPGSSLGSMLNASGAVRIAAPAKAGQATALILKLLEKDPARRPQTAAEVRDYFRKRERGISLSRRALAAAAVLAIIGAGVLGTQAYLRSSRARWARNEALPAVSQLMRESRWLAASDLLKQAERYIPASPELIRLKDLVPSTTATIETEPTGADIYIRDYTAPEEEPCQFLGRSPVTTDRLPGSYYPRGFYRIRAVKSGFATAEWASILGRVTAPPLKIELRSRSPCLPAWFGCPGGAGSFWIGVRTPGPIPGFWIDRLEVTNRQFKEFVDHGGYQKREYWKEPFRSGGRLLTWEQAMSQFRDATGRPGPSTWRLSDYPEGQADFPVGGVSWYEAAAYAEFAGKSLPTAYHWAYAGDTGPFSDAVNLGNFSGQGPAAGGKYRSLGPFGTLDMAGNVQEWVRNADGELRYTLGGAWNQPSYMAMGLDARPPLERQPYEGFRCVRYDTPPLPSFQGPIIRPYRDVRGEKPVDDQTYKIFQRLHEYDRADLNPTVDGIVDNAYWRLENVSFQAAYNGERMIAHLYLPKNATPPYQTVIYMGGIEILSIHHPDSAEAAGLAFGFLLRSGRAVLVPVFKGTMERGPMPGPPGPGRDREMRLAWSKDLGRSIDYLEVRPDIDLAKLAFGGVSYGAMSSPHLVALEPRIKALVLVSGGTDVALPPEVDSWNYAPRVTVPVLMINGRADFLSPLEMRQLPLLHAFGTPAKDKKHVLFDGGHATPVAQPDLIKAYLDWLDQYFGPVKLR